MQEVDKNIGNPNVLEIAPIGKGKRTLLFFADFFLSFIAAFFLFNVAVAPLGYLITNYEAKGEESATYEHMKLDILYGHKLLYFHEIDDKYYFPESLEFTYDVFLSYFCFDDENAGIINYPEFGHKKENDVIWTYFHDIRMTNSKYFTLFSTYANIEEESSFFVRQGDEFVLKPIYKDELVTHFDESADMSKIGKQYYDDIGENIFFNLYAEIITGIQRTNLSYSGIELSYNEAAKIAQKFEVFRQDYFTYSSIIAYFIAWLVYFFIIPLCRQKTPDSGYVAYEDSAHQCPPFEIVFKSRECNWKCLPLINWRFDLFLPANDCDGSCFLLLAFDVNLSVDVFTCTANHFRYFYDF